MCLDNEVCVPYMIPSAAHVCHTGACGLRTRWQALCASLTPTSEDWALHGAVRGLGAPDSS